MSYEPELGQFAFGNKWEELDLGDQENFVSNQLYYLSEQIIFATNDTPRLAPLSGSFGAYGVEFENQTFSTFPYYWGGCTCASDIEHKSDCLTIRPNFKCGDVIVNWYKYIGRGMSTNVELSRSEWNDLFQKCFKSLGII